MGTTVIAYVNLESVLGANTLYGALVEQVVKGVDFPAHVKLATKTTRLLYDLVHSGLNRPKDGMYELPLPHLYRVQPEGALLPGMYQCTLEIVLSNPDWRPVFSLDSGMCFVGPGRCTCLCSLVNMRFVRALPPPAALGALERLVAWLVRVPELGRV